MEKGLTEFVTNGRFRTSGTIVQLEAITEDTKSDGATNSFYGKGSLEEEYGFEPWNRKGDDGEEDGSNQGYEETWGCGPHREGMFGRVLEK